MSRSRPRRKMPANGAAVSLATSVQMAVRDRIRHDILNGRLMAGTGCNRPNWLRRTA